MKSLVVIVLICMLCNHSNGQRSVTSATRSRVPDVSALSASIENIVPPLFGLKKPGHYSAKDWQKLIDSVWGPGAGTATKLSFFDEFWNQVDQTWGGFPNLVVNWDSLRLVYRPLVAAGVSRGRFAGILSAMTRALNEWHVGARDAGIDATLGLYPNDIGDFYSYYPNHPSFFYRAGVPVVNINALFFRTPFGAGLTLLPDSSIMIYSVVPSHPLNLEPGDIILGYDGRSWKSCLDELMDAGLPILSSPFCGNWMGSTIAAARHVEMISAGMNWGLFDTIDVVKYSSNDTLHYPTSLLSTLSSPYLIATEQLPVSGVPFPDMQANKMVSWGVVAGTTIGYIYVWDWIGVPDGQTQIDFGKAVDDLVHLNNIQGLILDFRTNIGGTPGYADDGFKHLFNIDPTVNYTTAFRVKGANHFAFTIAPSTADGDHITPTPKLFDHPIAVLTGPRCGSSGDYNAFRMRFHPMVRFFGKKASGAYTDLPIVRKQRSPYWWRVDGGCVYSNYDNEGYMIHKAFPVDEDVWLTRGGVAKGKDDVVERALEWIKTLSYAHDVRTSKDTLKRSGDSITVTAKVENPSGHTLVVSVIITNAQGGQVDSTILMNDGVHGDAAPSDSIWGAFIKTPVSDGTYNISVRTDDKTSGTLRRLPSVALFTVSITGVTALVGILPQQFSLDQNYPNPFNPTTLIRYALPHRSHVTLTVFNTLGQQVAQLVNADIDAGYHEIQFNANHLASGVYFYRIQAGSYVETKKLCILR